MEAQLADNMAAVLRTVKALQEQVANLTTQLAEQQSPCHCQRRRQRGKKKQTRRAPLSETGRDGIIKWYSRRLAYGFVTRGDNGQDIFLHRSALPAQQRRSARPLDGAVVTFSIRKTRKGPEAAAVKLRRYAPAGRQDDTPVSLARPPLHGGEGTQQCSAPPSSPSGDGARGHAFSHTAEAPVTSRPITQRDADKQPAALRPSSYGGGASSGITVAATQVTSRPIAQRDANKQPAAGAQITGPREATPAATARDSAASGEGAKARVTPPPHPASALASPGAALYDTVGRPSHRIDTGVHSMSSRKAILDELFAPDENTIRVLRFKAEPASLLSPVATEFFPL